MFFSAIAAIIIFALRMVEQTAYFGDILMLFARYLCPTFSLCNNIIYTALSGPFMQRRDEIVRNMTRRRALLIPDNKYIRIYFSHLGPGGDWVSLFEMIWFYGFIFTASEIISLASMK
jgi:hypothetical protein